MGSVFNPFHRFLLRIRFSCFNLQTCLCACPLQKELSRRSPWPILRAKKEPARIYRYRTARFPAQMPHKCRFRQCIN